MKRLRQILSASLLAGVLTAYADCALVMELADGSTHEYEMRNRPRVTFSTGHVNVTGDNLSAAYPQEEFVRFYFRALPLSSLTQPATQKRLALTYIDRETVEITSEDYCGPIYIHDLTGRLMHTQPMKDGKAIVGIGNLKPGIHILSVSNQSVKIIRK